MNLKWIENDLDAIKELGVPYCAVKVTRGHETVFCGERGTEGSGKRFFLYSCSKVMTVAAALRLVQEGKLGLDDKVEKYLPAASKAFLIKDGKKCRPQVDMTVRHLFTMSAGLDYDLSKAPIKEAAAKEGADTQSIVSSFFESPLCFEPGERFQYSLCHDALVAVCENACGMKFDEYMRKTVFEPLGMERTSYAWDQEELAPKYVFGNGKFTPAGRTNDYILSSRYISGGAGVVGTVDDLSRFTETLACGGAAKDGYRLLNRETVELMRGIQSRTFFRNDNFSCAAGPEYDYGLGVHVLTRPFEGACSPTGSFGWDGAAGAYELCDPDRQVSIAFLTHVHGWPGIRPLFMRPLREAVYKALED